MDRNNHEQVAPQGHIVATVYADTDEYAWRRNNASTMDPHKLFPGANDKNSFRILPNQIVLARRQTETSHYELAFSTLAGLPKAQRERIRRELYFVGIASGNDDVQEGGVSVVKSGTMSIANRGPKDIFAGDLLMFDLPRDDSFHVQGTVNGGSDPIVVPARHADLMPSIELSLWAMSSQDPEVGIFGLDIDVDTSKLSPIQEEAHGMKFGEGLKAARVIEWYVAKNLGAVAGLQAAKDFFEDYQTRSADILSELYFRETQQENSELTKLMSGAYMRAEKARYGAMMAKWGCVIGTAMNSASANGGTLDVMLRLA